MLFVPWRTWGRWYYWFSKVRSPVSGYFGYWSVLGPERRTLFGHSCHVPAPYTCSLWLPCKVLSNCTWITSWVTRTISVILISSLLPEAWTQPPAPSWHLLPYCWHSWLQVWKSGRMGWKYCFFHMHSYSNCSSNVLKKFSLSKCIFTYLHFRFMLLPIHFTFCIIPNAYFNCWYLGSTRTGGKWGEERD